MYNSGPQPFWHQGLVSWKTIFPQTGGGDVSGSNVSDGGDGSGGNASDGSGDNVMVQAIM